MAKYVFPAVFTPAEEGGYLVTFPDIDNVFTDGDTKEEAIENASDALNLMLYHTKLEDIPAPTDINELKAPKGGFLSFVLADLDKYQETIDKENNPIRYSMKKSKLSIKQVSELLDAPYRTVQNWWRGEKKPAKWVEKLVIEKIEESLSV